MDSQMKWTKHTDNISNKCLRAIGTLHIIKHILPTRTQISMYNSRILPDINYCIIACGIRITVCLSYKIEQLEHSRTVHTMDIQNHYFKIYILF